MAGAIGVGPRATALVGQIRLVGDVAEVVVSDGLDQARLGIEDRDRVYYTERS
jgi:hypothetical protein